MMQGRMGWALLIAALLGMLPVCGWAKTTALHVNNRLADGELCIDAAGIYEITGEAEELQVRIQAPKDARVTLVLRDAQWSCEHGAAIYAESGDVTIQLRGGNNRISGGSEAQPAAVYVMDDLEIEGDGLLHISGLFKNGVECRDTLTIRSGKLNVSAVWDGIRGRDHLTVCGGNLRIDAGNDGLKANNDQDPGMGSVSVCGGAICITAGDDAIHAENRTEISGGTLLIERCFEGIEGNIVHVSGGDIRITADDDGLNAVGEHAAVEVMGGDIWIDANGDGVDSGGGLVLRGGTLVINGTTSPRNSALDFMETSRAEGSILFTAGSAAMAQAPKAAGDQCTLRIYFDVMQRAGETVSLHDENGGVLLAFRPLKDYQAIVIAHPVLKQGMTIAVRQGADIEGLAPGEAQEGGDSQGGERLCTVKLDDVRVSIDEHGKPCDAVANSFGW